jgi:hypothetical protein
VQVLWDSEDPNIFVASNSAGELYGYLFTRHSVLGQQLKLLCQMKLATGNTPVVLTGQAELAFDLWYCPVLAY